MTLNIRINKIHWLIPLFLSCCFYGFSQGDTKTIKAQVALGANAPSVGGFVDGYSGKLLNMPTVNLGMQYMFKRRLGGKLDYGFNRISNETDVPDFKINYSRINIQAVYDASHSYSARSGLFFHGGPGVSMVKPLSGYTENKKTYLNMMAGAELHYGISEKLSLYLDASYVLGFSKKFNPISDGFGSFNGNLLTITIGLSVSLSGCYYCTEWKKKKE